MNFGSVSPDPPKGHKNLDNCVRDETRAIHSVPHMQAGGQLARENGFFVSNNGPVAPSAIQLRALTSTTVERDLARTLANTSTSTRTAPVLDRTTSRDAQRTRTRSLSSAKNHDVRLARHSRCTTAPKVLETAPHAPVSSPFGASQARPVERVRRVTPPRARPARRSARQPQVRDPSTPRGSNLFRSARAKYSSPQASPRTSGYRRWIDPRDGACDRSTFAFAASRLSPTSDSAVPCPNRPSPRDCRLHLADFEIKRDASTRRRGVRGRRRACFPRPPTTPAPRERTMTTSIS